MWPYLKNLHLNVIITRNFYQVNEYIRKKKAKFSESQNDEVFLCYID